LFFSAIWSFPRNERQPALSQGFRELPIDSQLLIYLFFRGAYATHGKYWEELNVWLNDKNIDELDMARLYQELMLRKREVDLELKFKGPSPTNNNLAMQLHSRFIEELI
jgi:hypothetical protein